MSSSRRARGRGSALAIVAPAVVFLVLLAIPALTADRYILTVFLRFYPFCMLAYSINLIAGYTGQLSLAHGGLFGIGAYAYGLLVIHGLFNTWAALAAGAFLAAGLSIPIGLVGLRARGAYFAVGSLGLGMLISVVAEQWTDLTRGTRGLIGVSGLTPIGGIAVDNMIGQYYVGLALLGLTVLCLSLLVHSPVGRTFVAIRENEELSKAVGLATMRNKVLSFTISAFFAGLAGAYYANFVGYVTPAAAGIFIGFDPVVYMVAGGAGTLPGPLIGTAILFLIPESLRMVTQYRMIVYGVFLVLLVIFLPQGIWGTIREMVSRRRRETLRVGRGISGHVA